MPVWQVSRGGALGLTGCSGIGKPGAGGGAAAPKNSGVALKGTFVVEPTEAETKNGLDFSAIPDTRKLVLAVFDLENKTEKNWKELTPECTLAYDSDNEYQAADGFDDLPDQMQTFIKRCGYHDAAKSVGIDAGADPVRVLACFLVNKADVKKKATLTVKHDTNAQGTFEIKAKAVKSIVLPDLIFEVEKKNADAYQLVKSMPARATLIYSLLSASTKTQDTATALVSLATASALISPDTTWGVSIMAGSAAPTVTATVGSDKLPRMNYDTMATLDKKAADDARAIADHLKQIADALPAGNITAANTAKDALVTVLYTYMNK